MSQPTTEVCESILERCGLLLDEWDSSRYFLACRDDGGVWNTYSDCDGADKLLLAHVIMGQALTQVEKRDQ